MSESAENLVELKAVEKVFIEKMDELKETIGKAEGQAKEAGTVANETKSAIDGISENLNELGDRLQEMEQKGVKIASDEEGAYDLGAEFIKSDQFKAFQAGQFGGAKMELKAAIINATGQNQPLVQSDRLGGIIDAPHRALSIRDVMPSSATNSNLVEFVRTNTVTHAAGPQIGGSPEAFENVTKPESTYTFSLVSEPVQTLAHFIPASKQVIADSASLQSFINGQLMYGLKLYEENQLITGSGANGQLNGINTQATAYNIAGQSPQLTNEIDIIRDMIKQCEIANYTPDAIIMNPGDWFDIDIRKVGSSDDRYVVGNPRSMSQPNLWGIPVIVTNAMTAGTAIVGNFMMGCEIKDREQATVEVSRENGTNFTDNMLTILAEERIALCVYRIELFITGSI